MIDKIAKKIIWRDPEVSKIHCGRALIIAGSQELCFSARLNTLAALRAGCGWIVLAVHEDLKAAVQSWGLPVKLIAIPRLTNIKDINEGINKLMPYCQLINVVAIGAGMGMLDITHNFIAQFLARAASLYPDLRYVIDASAYYPIYKEIEKSPLQFRNQVWMPNSWELKNLLGSSLPKKRSEIITKIKSITDKYGMTWVLKGKGSVVLHPLKENFINSTGNAGMAVTGMGDVLGGIVACFIAQGISNYEATVFGTYLHGLAGDIAYKKYGNGLLPEDVVESIPFALEVVVNNIRSTSNAKELQNSAT